MALDDTEIPVTADPDATLMLRVCDGDEAAFSELVTAYQKKVLNFFLRMGVQYDIEDLAQQTFLRLYRYRNRYQPRAKVSTFLFLLARQVWIDELRKRTRRKKLADSVALETAGAVVPSVADEVASRDVADVQQALAQLPEAMRLVVELGVYQELPYSEIAEILEIPEGTVKSRMFNALTQLRTILKRA